MDTVDSPQDHRSEMEVFAVYTIQNWRFMFGLNEKPLEKL
jgi:hypothetical protein